MINLINKLLYKSKSHTLFDKPNRLFFFFFSPPNVTYNSEIIYFHHLHNWNLHDQLSSVGGINGNGVVSVTSRIIMIIIFIVSQSLLLDEFNAVGHRLAMVRIRRVVIRPRHVCLVTMMMVIIVCGGGGGGGGGGLGQS